MSRQYHAIWQSFIKSQSTYATQSYQWPVWHSQGRKQFCFWAILPEDAALEQTVQAATQALAPFLLKHYQKSTHITLYAAGFLVEQKHAFDDVTWPLLEQQAMLIQQYLQQPLWLETGAINSFTGAPFIEVMDDKQQLQGLHRALCQAFGSDRDNALCLHITLGLYNQSYLIPEIRKKIENITVKSHKIACRHIALVAYNSDDIRSPLRILKNIALTGRQYS